MRTAPVRMQGSCALDTARSRAQLVDAVLLSQLLQHLPPERRLIPALLLFPLRLQGARRIA